MYFRIWKIFFCVPFLYVWARRQRLAFRQIGCLRRWLLAGFYLSVLECVCVLFFCWKVELCTKNAKYFRHMLTAVAEKRPKLGNVSQGVTCLAFLWLRLLNTHYTDIVIIPYKRLTMITSIDAPVVGIWIRTYIRRKGRRVGQRKSLGAKPYVCLYYKERRWNNDSLQGLYKYLRHSINLKWQQIWKISSRTPRKVRKLT